MPIPESEIAVAEEWVKKQNDYVRQRPDWKLEYVRGLGRMGSAR